MFRPNQPELAEQLSAQKIPATGLKLVFLPLPLSLKSLSAQKIPATGLKPLSKSLGKPRRKAFSTKNPGNGTETQVSNLLHREPCCFQHKKSRQRD